MLGGIKEVYSGLDEIAAFLRLSTVVLSRYINNGQVKIKKLGGAYTAHREQLLKIIENGVEEVKVKVEETKGEEG
ncbi:hypothetical protein [Maridesulfovibrio ferrireducens]|uniref:hypothetical protein n=1 Tax=Maridesulfovibrio ferrireducens TaxID=246191 RepID=UPI001A2A2951|nr:hypothetical protein [Maridesulfovibrio ferrireducens]MBI9110269.1 hypothetical protein [Maridesulfovibrio ferrireducens]